MDTLFIELWRHFLNFEDMTYDEQKTYGESLHKLYGLVKHITNAERIYAVVLLESVSHFHTWFIPRRAKDNQRGIEFLAEDIGCKEKDAAA